MNTDGISAASLTPPAIAPAAKASRSKAQARVQDASARTCDQADGATIWRAVGQRFDVRNMNLAEMDKMAMQLYQDGAISLLDSGIMSFDPTRIPVGGQRLLEDSIRLTKADAQGRRDWISEYEQQKARAETLGETQNAANYARILDVLKRVQAGGGKALNQEV
ncbi:MAG: hypothetical protein A2051_09850 [Desulfovibrionales bacterium GWA2_65_9]|nr:MAG: hypothetical protein A2051_09850 [Desulfovibrionales bacterium GWA2_65_9]